MRELLNYRDAFELVSEYLLSGTPLTESVVREIHRRLVDGVRGNEGQPGEYRQVQNVVANNQTGEVIYRPPPWGDVPELMTQLVTWLNRESDIHPILMAAIAQFQLVHIHPFVDGNRRTSRLLSTLCLYRSGYDFKRLFTISEFYDHDRRAFYDAIQGVRDAGMDLTGWLEFFTTGLSTQMQEMVDRGERVIRADVMSKQLKLNARQSAAVAHLMEFDKMNIGDFEQLCPDINRRSLQRDLRRLVELQVIENLAANDTDPNRQYKLKGL